MSIIYNTHKCQPFYNNYGPLNVMRNGKKIAGWSKKSIALGGNSYPPSHVLTGTYNDKLEFILKGGTTEKAQEQIGTWKQIVQNPKPCTSRQNGISTRTGQVSYGNDYIEMETGNSNKCAIDLHLPYPIQTRHTFLCALFPSIEVTQATSYMEFSMNTSSSKLVDMTVDINGYNEWVKGIVWRVSEYDDNYDYITLTLYGSYYGEYIHFNRVAVIDLTLLLGDDNLQISSFYNNNIDELTTLASNVFNIDPTPEATTETVIPGIVIPYLSSPITPDTPGEIEAEEVMIKSESTGGVEESVVYNLHTWEELRQDGTISSYGQIKEIGDINWSDEGNNKFGWNAYNDIIRTESVFMDYYPRVSSLVELASVDYGFFINIDTRKVYIKDKDCLDPQSFKANRQNGKIYYYSGIVTRRSVDINTIHTFPYTTTVTTSSDATVSYKKWDESQPD